MMQIKNFFEIALIMFLCLSLPAQNSEKMWSKYQGKMKWKVAMKNCADLGMRLPTGKELWEAHNEGLTKEGKSYWVSGTLSNSTAYAFHVSYGKVGYKMKKDTGDLLCIR